MSEKFSITAILGVDSSALQKGLKSSMSKVSAWAKSFANKIAGAAKAAGVAAGRAVADFTRDSLMEFGNFEKGMNEVFTLLPGISEEAMGEMEAQTLSLAREMGVLPEEVVPALYQALSAGVDPKNVFEFMKTSAKASIGGITTLETAVDGLTSATNSYGAENLSAADAADIMFTTVKLGKTTMEELSSRMYNVIPIASAAGVEFGTVGAALADLTAKGVPTAQATTQLRAAIQSLTAPTKAQREQMEKMGIDVDKLKETVGSGPDGLVKAMNMLQEATEGDMEALRKLVGTVEGVQAILALTKDDAKGFKAALEEMGEAAGATDEAFGTMDQGFLRSMERMKAELKATMIEFGKALMPLVEMIIPVLQKLVRMLGKLDFTKIAEKLKALFDEIAPIFQDLATEIRGLPWDELAEFAEPVLKMLIDMAKKVMSIMKKLLPALIPLLKVLIGWYAVLAKRIQVILTVVEEMADGLATIISGVANFVASIMSLIIDPTPERIKKVGEKALAMIKKIGKGIVQFIEGLFKGIGKVIANFIGMVSPELKQMVLDFLENFSLIKEGGEGAFGFLGEWVKMAKQKGAEIKEAAAKLFKALLEGGKNATDGIGEGAKKLFDQIKRVVPIIAKALGELVPVLIDIGGEFIKLYMHFYEKMAPVLGKVINLVLKLAGTFAFFVLEGVAVLAPLAVKLIKGIWWVIKNLVIPVIKVLITVFSVLYDIVVTVLTGIFDLFKWLHGAISTIIEAIAYVFIRAFDIISDTVSKVIKFIKDLFQMLHDFIYDILIGGTVTKIFQKAFDIIWGIVQKVLNLIMELFQTFHDMVVGILEAIDSLFTTIFEGIKMLIDTVVGGIIETIQAFFDMVKEGLEFIEGLFGAVFGAIGGIAKGVFGALKSGFGAVKNVASGALNGIKGAAKSAFEGIKSFAKGALDKVKGFFGETESSANETVGRVREVTDETEGQGEALERNKERARAIAKAWGLTYDQLLEIIVLHKELNSLAFYLWALGATPNPADFLRVSIEAAIEAQQRLNDKAAEYPLNELISEIGDGEIKLKFGDELKPAMNLLASMDKSLKSIDNTLKGKFVNQ